MKTFIDLFFIISIVFAMMSSIILSSKVLRLLIMTQKQINFLSAEQFRIKCLLDFLGSSISHPLTRNIYRKLRNKSLEEFPDTREEFVKIVQETNNENFKVIHDNLLKTIEETEDIEIKKGLETKLEQLQNLKNLSDLVDENSSEEYLQNIAAEMTKITKEIFGSNEL